MRTAEDTVRAFYACYTKGRPDGFADVVAADYRDYGHDPAGVGVEGARADYDQAVRKVGGITTYVIDALVVDGGHVAVAWTGKQPSAGTMRGLRLYRVSGGLVRSTRRTRIEA